MGVVTASYLDRLLRRELRTTPAGTNHDIYDNRLTAAYPPEPFRTAPRRIYFYYMTLDQNNAPSVEHYLYENKDAGGVWVPIAEGDLEGLVTKLVRNARTTKSTPPVHGHNFVNVEWRHRSYIVIIIDEQGWAFQKRADGNTAAAFNVTKGSTLNHTFFDATDLRVSVDGDTRYAIAFINHMKKDADGNDIKDTDPPQEFVFDVYLDVQYRGSPDFITVILDPGGTNLGPIVEP